MNIGMKLVELYVGLTRFEDTKQVIRIPVLIHITIIYSNSHGR